MFQIDTPIDFAVNDETKNVVIILMFKIVHVILRESFDCFAWNVLQFQ